VEFATKPELAVGMLTRALDAGVPAAWLTGDAVYGQHPGLRRFCAARGLSYVLAVASSQWVWAASDADQMPRQQRAAALGAAIPAQAFKKISAGAGAKGPRFYAWARTETHPRPEDGTRSWLLVRRSLTDGERAYYLCHAPATTTLTELVRVAGARWAIEETFQTGKGEVGLDHYQVRRYDGWYRHITLAMFAHAFLTATRATAGKKGLLTPA
jgi:SRSO17 transposase